MVKNEYINKLVMVSWNKILYIVRTDYLYILSMAEYVFKTGYMLVGLIDVVVVRLGPLGVFISGGQQTIEVFPSRQKAYLMVYLLYTHTFSVKFNCTISAKISIKQKIKTV